MRRYINAAVITGPTQTGKTAVAVALARRHDIEFINSDKFYLFRECRVGTGLSDLLLCDQSPKHLYEILEPGEPILAVSKYVRYVEAIAARVLSRGRLPLIEGCAFSFNQALVNLNGGAGCTFHYRPVVCLRWATSVDLRRSLQTRLEAMMQNGLLVEVESLMAGGGGRSSYPAQKGLVYRPLIRYLKSELSLEEAKELFVADSLRVAMDQLRRYETLADVTWIEHDSDRLDETVAQVDCLVRHYAMADR
jgi:tRNA A37 N6-isopentenylltransferase MiaA